MTENIQNPEAVEDVQAEQATEVVLYTFSNRSPAPELDQILYVFYTGVWNNKLGIMQAMNAETGQEELLLVGVEPVEGEEPNIYPLCTMLKAEDVVKYHAPDGKGGWKGYDSPSDERN